MLFSDLDDVQDPEYNVCGKLNIGTNSEVDSESLIFLTELITIKLNKLVCSYPILLRIYDATLILNDITYITANQLGAN